MSAARHKMLSTPCRARLRAARHYRTPAPGDMPRKAPPAASGRRPVVTGLAPRTVRPTNTATARIMVSLSRITSMSGRPGFAARGTLRPLSTTIRRTSVALPGPSVPTAAMRRWAAGSSGSTDAKLPPNPERHYRDPSVFAASLLPPY